MSPSNSDPFAAVGFGSGRGRPLPWPEPRSLTPPASPLPPLKSYAEAKRRLAVGAVATVDWLRMDGLTGRRDEAVEIVARDSDSISCEESQDPRAHGPLWGQYLPERASEAERDKQAPSITWRLEHRQRLWEFSDAMTAAEQEELRQGESAARLVRLTLLQEAPEIWSPAPTHKRRKPMSSNTDELITEALGEYMGRGHWDYPRWRYWYFGGDDPREPIVGWSTEADDDGRYLSWAAPPAKGLGTTGTHIEYRLDPASIGGHRRRTDARDRAQKLQRQWLEHGGRPWA